MSKASILCSTDNGETRCYEKKVIWITLLAFIALDILQIEVLFGARDGGMRLRPRAL